MEITLSVPDDLINAYGQSGLEIFLKDALQAELQKQAADTKWHAMISRIKAGEFDLGDYTEQFNRDRAEFRGQGL
jgi:hypothetical protein